MILFIQIIFHSVVGNYQKGLITPIVFNSLIIDFSNNFNNSIMSKEIIFKHNIIPFGVLLLGLLIIFYGAYHFRMGLIIQSSMLIYFILCEILKYIIENSINNDKYYYYLLLFSFISGILIYIFMSSKKVNTIKYKFQLILYGFIFGFFLSYTIIDYIKNFPKFLLYFNLFIPTFIGGIIYYFNPLKKYSFIPCSTISGSFLITKSLNYIASCQTSCQDSNKQDEQANITCFIIQIILILISIAYQIFHIKYKEIEDPAYYEIKKIDIDEDDDETNEREIINTDSNLENQELDNKNSNLLSKNNINEDNEDEDINDQED